MEVALMPVDRPIRYMGTALELPETAISFMPELLLLLERAIQSDKKVKPLAAIPLSPVREIKQ
jgi:hypothetical protein